MEKQYNPLAENQSISPPSSVPSPGDLKQDFFDQMAGNLDEKTFPKINITKKNEFKMPEVNLDYIRSNSMSNFLNVDEFSENQIKADADFETDSIQTNEDDYEQIMIHKGAIGFAKSAS